MFISRSDIPSWNRGGTSWTCRCVFVGYNGKNVKGSSSKFWQLEGDGNGRIASRWGKIGTSGQRSKTTHTAFEGREKLGKKLNKGYTMDTRTKRGISPHPVIPVAPKLSPLEGPFATIRFISPLGTDFAALDVNRDMVMMLPQSGATQLLKYPNISRA